MEESKPSSSPALSTSPTRTPQPTSSDRPSYQTRPTTYHRPFTVFHPTRAEFHPHPDYATESQESLQWNSRESRKKRYEPIPLSLEHRHRPESIEAGVHEKHQRDVAPRANRASAHFKPHFEKSLAFVVAMFFVVGSLAWVANGFLLLLPLLNVGDSDSLFPSAAATAFVGGTMFEFGAYLALVEALNSQHEALFGDAISAAFFHNCEKPSKFRWYGWGDWRDLGYLGNAIQMAAASIFWVSTFSGLPGVIPNFPKQPPDAVTAIFFWTPQVLGGTGFMIASILLMLETQRAWYIPNLKSVGYHVAFWNFIGALGFTLCPAFGYGSVGSTKLEFQSVLSTFWGGWAFLIGSLLQLYEAMWRGA